jgi:hypothetical protein
MAIAWPEIVEGAWVKIATNVTSGTINKLKSEFTYWVTSVSTGAAAPEAAIKLKSPKIFEDSNQEIIDSSVSIDVYIWIENADGNTNSTIADSIEVNAI